MRRTHAHLLLSLLMLCAPLACKKPDPTPTPAPAPAAASVDSKKKSAADDDDDAKQKSKKKKKPKADDDDSKDDDSKKSDSKDDDDTTASAKKPHKKKPKPPPAADGVAQLADVDTMTPAPTSPDPKRSAFPAPKDWAAAKPIALTNAAAQGCEGKVISDWLRIACEGKGIQSVTVDRSTKRDTAIRIKPSMAIVVTSFVAGSDVAATFRWAKQTQQVTAKWATGAKMPDPLGAFAKAGAVAMKKRGSLTKGAECYDYYDCANGYYCDYSVSSGRCLPMTDYGCHWDDDCGDGWYCADDGSCEVIPSYNPGYTGDDGSGDDTTTAPSASGSASSNNTGDDDDDNAKPKIGGAPDDH